MDTQTHPTPGQTAVTIANQIATTISNLIGTTEYLSNSAIISSLTAIVAHFVRETRRESSVKKAISIASLITNFNTLISSLSYKFKDFNVEGAMQVVLSAFEDSPNSTEDLEEELSRADHYNNILSILFKVLVVGLNVLGYDKDIVLAMTKIKASKELISSLEDAKDFMTSEILNMPLNREKITISKLTHAYKVLKACYLMERKDFILKPTSIKSFESAITSAEKMIEQTSKMSSSSPSLNTLKGSLSTLVMKSLDRILSIRECIQESHRQEPTGVLLMGRAGGGKTNLGEFIARRLAKLQGWSSHIYNLRVGTGFFESYADQELGSYEDAFNYREPDRFLKDITALMGTNHYNMEGAGLDTKHQACHLKHITVTTNVEKDVKLSTYIADEGIKAIYSRFIQVLVDDENIPVGSDPRYQEYTHRKPDFSHLKLTLVRLDPITKNYLSEDPITVEELITKLNEAINKRKLQYKAALAEAFPEDFPETLAAGREDHLFMRFQGNLGTGKGTTLDKVTHFLKTVYRFNIFPIEDLEHALSQTYPSDSTNVFLIDDLDIEIHHDSYLRFLRSIKNSIIFILTNKIYTPQKSGYLKCIANWLNPTSCDTFTETDLPVLPLMRRIGLEGFVKQNETTYNNSLITNYCFTFLRTDKIIFRDEIIDQPEVFNRVISGIIAYKKAKQSFVFLQQPHPNPSKNFDITVISSNLNQLKTDLSRQSIARTALNFGTTKLKFSKELIKNTSGRVIIDDFIVEPGTSEREIINCLLERVLRIYPEVTISVTIGSDTYRYESQIVYVNRLFDGITISHTSSHLIIKSDQSETQIFLSDAMRFFLNRELGTLELPHSILPDVLNYIQSQVDLVDPLITMHLTQQAVPSVTISTALTDELTKLIKDHPILTIGSTMIVALGVVYGAYKLFQSLSKDEEDSDDEDLEDDTPNTDPDAKGLGGKSIGKKKLNRLRRRLVRERDLLDPSYSPEDAQAYTKYTQAIESGNLSFLDTPNFKRLAKNSITHKVLQKALKSDTPEMVDDILDIVMYDTPNSLSRISAIDDRTIIDPLPSVLESNYYQIEVLAGRAHALILKGKIGLTVNHVFDKIGQTALISNDQNSYPVVCYAKFPHRDLALFRVLDSQFNAKNILKHVIDSKDLENSSTYYYLRYGATKSIFPGQATYSAYYKTSSSSNPGWNPTSDIITFHSITLSDSAIIYNKGDCGFPLIAKDSQQRPKVTGIHIAFNASARTGRFAALTTEIVQELFKDDTTNMCEDFVPTKISERIAAALLPPKIEVSQLNILGSLPRPHSFYMKPKCIRYPNLGQSLENQTDCDFAPVNINQCSEEAKATMPKTIDGKPDILMKQAIKYGTTTGKVDRPHLFERAVHIVEEAWLKRYGRTRILNMKEALNHISGLYPYSKPFPRDTSAGYAYKELFGLNDKQEILINRSKPGVIPIYDIKRESPVGLYCKEMVDLRWSNALLGKPVASVAMDCKKVELLPMEKVSKGDVRLFNTLDLDYNICQKRLFGHIQAVMIKERDKGFSQVGISPQIEFDRIYRFMEEIEGRRRYTDFSRFDKSHREKMMMACHTVVANLCDDSNYTREEINNLYSSFGKSYATRIHVCGEHVYQTSDGHTSGSMITPLMNNFAVEVSTNYCMLCFIEDHRPEFNDIEQDELYQLYRMLCYGDDRDIKLGEFFNDYTFEMEREYMAELNYTLTQASKISSKTSASFISRTYITDDYITYGALKKSSINRHLHFAPSLNPEHIKAVFDIALQEAVPWGREYYNSVKRDIGKLLSVLPNGHLVSKGLLLSDFTTARTNLREHIRFSNQFGFLTSPATQEFKYNIQLSDNQLSQLTSYEKYIIKDESFFSPNSSPRENLSSIIMALVTPKTGDYISDTYIYLQKIGATERPIDESHNKQGFWYWSTTLGFEKDYPNIPKGTLYCASGRGVNKQAAKEIAYKQLFVQLPPLSTFPQVMNQAQLDHNLKCLFGPMKYHYFTHPDTTQTCAALYFVDGEPKMAFTRSTNGVIAKQELCISLVNFGLQHQEEVEQTLPSITEGDDMTEILRKLNEKSFYYDPETIQLKDQISDIVDTVLGERPPEDRELLKDHFLDNISSYSTPDDSPNMDSLVNPMAAPPSQQSYAPQQSSSTTNTSTANLPQQAAPQDIGPIPVLPLPLESTASTAIPESTFLTLNPIGPTNMLNVGGVEFDLKTLIYTQPMATDIQYVFTDDMAQGQILLQIPYDVNSEYVNPYIRAYAQLHSRFAGSLLYNFRLVGNATFSGELMWGWQPRKLPGTTVQISQLQKYSWTSISCNTTQSATLELKDARKNDFYREVADSDVDNRPHLVLASYITLISPLREGITVRMRINTVLSNGSYCEALVFADPVIAAEAIANNRTCANADITMGDLFPTIETLQLQTDGFRRLPWALNGTQQGERRQYSISEYARKHGFASSGYAPNLSPNKYFLNKKFHDAVASKDYYMYAVHHQQPYQPILWGENHDEFLAKLEAGTAIDGNTLFVCTKEEVNQLTTGINIWRPDNFTLEPVTLENIYHLQTVLGYIDIYEASTDSRGPTTLKNSCFAPSFNDTHFVEPYHITSIVKGDPINLPALPAGWVQANIFENDESYTVSSGFALTGYATNRPSQQVYRYFAEKAKCLGATGSTTVLQFDLVDPISGQTIATLRYRAVEGVFAINPAFPTSTNRYRLFQNDIKNCFIHNLAVVVNASTFQKTDVSLWDDRVSAPIRERSLAIKEHQLKAGTPALYEVEDDTPNWLNFTAGLMSGIGQGMSKVGDRKHEKEMLDKQNAQATAMQGTQHAHEMAQQGGMFQHDARMKQGQNQWQSLENTVANNRRVTNNMGIVGAKAKNPGRNQALYEANERTHEQDQNDLFMRLATHMPMEIQR